MQPQQYLLYCNYKGCQESRDEGCLVACAASAMSENVTCLALLRCRGGPRFQLEDFRTTCLMYYDRFHCISGHIVCPCDELAPVCSTERACRYAPSCLESFRRIAPRSANAYIPMCLAWQGRPITRTVGMQLLLVFQELLQAKLLEWSEFAVRC